MMNMVDVYDVQFHMSVQNKHGTGRKGNFSKEQMIMELIENINREINLSADIQTISFLSETELVILTCAGEVILYNVKSEHSEILFETNSTRGIRYLDGGFDPTAESSIYTMDDIIVVVNDYKKHGFVFNRRENYLIHFSREDYHAEISRYPVALFYRFGEPHIVYSVAWNRLHITNLTTRQVLTADKSLIKENAEQSHLDFYQKHEEGNKLFWPYEYDYFFGELILSPNHQKFLSAGWVWGSFDYCNLFDIEDFISNHRIKEINIGGWEHDHRSICFVDDETIAVLYNPYTEDGADKDTPYEIRLYHTNGEGEKGIIVLQSALKLDGAQLIYQKSAHRLCTFSPEVGLAVISMSGELVFHSPDVSIKRYDERYDQFICYDKKQFMIYQLRS